MPKSEIEETCKKIYQKHQQALDLIFQYKPDIQSEVSVIIQDILKSHREIIVDWAAKSAVYFTSEHLDRLLPKKGEGWGTGNRILLFEFVNSAKRLVLRLIIGPGDSALRNKLHNIAKKDTRLCNKADRKLTPKWLTIYQREYLKASDYEEINTVELKENLLKKVNRFVADDLVKIEKHITNNWKSN